MLEVETARKIARPPEYKLTLENQNKGYRMGV